MNSISEILLEYELRIVESDLSVGDFIRGFPDGLDEDLIIALIGVAAERKLKAGKPLEIPEIHADVSSLPKQRINEVVAESVHNFVQSYCPVTDHLGSMPVEYDGYRIDRELGRGGTGVVYAAEHLGMNRVVAIKVLFSAMASIVAEANILSRIVHPNICVVYDVGKLDGLTYISMQNIKGHSLERFCKNPPQISIERALKIMIEVLDAIIECHGRGIVHWDLKPSNIMISNDKPVLVDFGLARHLGSTGQLVSGSPKYMAPEMLLSDARNISPTMCDVYGVGVILYLMLTGHLPYSAGASAERDSARRPSDFRKEIDEELNQVVLDSIAVSPFDRTPTANRFRLALKNCYDRLYVSKLNSGERQLGVSSAGGVKQPNGSWPTFAVTILVIMLIAVCVNLALTIFLIL